MEELEVTNCGSVVFRKRLRRLLKVIGTSFRTKTNVSLSILKIKWHKSLNLEQISMKSL